MIGPDDYDAPGGYCPECGRPLSNLMVNGRGGCEAHGSVSADWQPRTVAFALVAANGEVYAIRDSQEAAEAMRPAAEGYLDDAYASAHPAAGAYCNARTPFRVEALTFEEHEEALEDGPGLLDREPSDDDLYRNL